MSEKLSPKRKSFLMHKHFVQSFSVNYAGMRVTNSDEQTLFALTQKLFPINHAQVHCVRFPFSMEIFCHHMRLFCYVCATQLEETHMRNTTVNKRRFNVHAARTNESVSRTSKAVDEHKTQRCIKTIEIKKHRI
jgi:hypothetical protein